MATLIIDKKTAAESSGDFSVAAGSPRTISLTSDDSAYSYKKSSDNPLAYIELKTSDNIYIKVGYLSFKEPAKIIDGVGTYRITKGVTSVNIGVDGS